MGIMTILALISALPGLESGVVDFIKEMEQLGPDLHKALDDLIAWFKQPTQANLSVVLQATKAAGDEVIADMGAVNNWFAAFKAPPELTAQFPWLPKMLYAVNNAYGDTKAAGATADQIITALQLALRPNMTPAAPAKP